MRPGRLLTLATAAPVVAAAAGLLVLHVVTGSGFGLSEIAVLLGSGLVAIVLAQRCARIIARRQQDHLALRLAEQAKAGAQMTQAVIKTALDAFVQTDANGIVLDWSFQAEALTGWTRQEALGSGLN